MTLSPSAPWRVREIARLAAAAYDVDEASIFAKDRHKRVAHARHCAFWVARQVTGLSFPEIGRAFGKRDHSTVMSGCSQHLERAFLSEEVADLTRRICDAVKDIGLLRLAKTSVDALESAVGPDVRGLG